MALLKEPVKAGNVVLHNRLVMPPMKTGKADADGGVTDELVTYYAERARGGAIGLVITEHHYVREDGIASLNQVSAAKDADIPGLARIAEAVHAEGSAIIMQLNHAGSATSETLVKGKTRSASAVRHPKAKGNPDEIPVPFTEKELEGVIGAFADAAERAQKAGYDGVEIHSAHGYLLNQFFSPLTNRRTDAYTGSSIEGRILLQRQILRAVRERTGKDFLLALRLGGCDYSEIFGWKIADAQGRIETQGSTIADAVEAARIFEKDGDLDLLDLTGGLFGFVIPGRESPGYMKDLSSQVKRAVSLPVILTGGVTEAAQAQQLLQEGAADLIGVGRALMADPAWARRQLNERT